MDKSSLSLQFSQSLTHDMKFIELQISCNFSKVYNTEM